jgi:hypothetical protein
MLAATALAIAAAQAQIVPNTGAVWSALDRYFIARCGGRRADADCVRGLGSINVRDLDCTAEADDRALCRYERRLVTIGGRRLRETAETRFRYRRDVMIWSIERDFPPTPGHDDIAGAMVDEANRPCLTLIDHCIDEDGNPLHAEPRIAVSDARCRPAGVRRARCSFRAIRDGRRSRCSGTLAAGDDGEGGRTWNFLMNPRRESAPAVRCN